jgi:nicotinate-nucleotide pyrophosphorylase (carboxylating)
VIDEPLDRTWPTNEARALIDLALAEDIGAGDRTSEATIPASLAGVGFVKAKAAGVLAGLPGVAQTYSRLDPDVHVELVAADGEPVRAGDLVLRIAGPYRSLLAGERVSLNLLAHLSGIATLTSRFVDEVRGTAARILDTRKTTPGFRALEKYAVRCGGGGNHRAGLDDMILVKENHIAAAGGVREALLAVARAGFGLPVEIEVRTLAEAIEAIDNGARLLLLDNMSVETVRSVVSVVRSRAPDACCEVSGGLSLSTVRAYAEAGADRLSVGALTHSATALDLSMIVSRDTP